MTAEEFLNTLCQHLQIDVPEKDASARWTIDFDDNLSIRLEPHPGASVRISADVCDIPSDDFRGEALLRGLLQRALSRMHDEFETLTTTTDGETAQIFRDVPEEVESSEVMSITEEFVNHLEGWVQSVATSESASTFPVQMLRP